MEIVTAHGAQLSEDGQVLKCRLDAVLFLPLYILGDCVQRASSCQILVGIGSVLTHGVKLADHKLFNICADGRKSACRGHIIGNYQFLKLCLVDIGIQIILNSYFIHGFHPFIMRMQFGF